MNQPSSTAPSSTALAPATTGSPTGAPATSAPAKQGDQPHSDQPSQLAHLRWEQVAKLVWEEAHEEATENTLTALASDPIRWEGVLLDLLEQTDDSLRSIRHMPRQVRRQIVADFRADQDDLTAAYVRLTGREPSPPVAPPTESPVTDKQAAAGDKKGGKHSKKRSEQNEAKQMPVDPCALQLSWDDGRIVAWSAGANNEPEPIDMVLERLAATGAIEDAWSPYKPVKLLPGSKSASAEAVSADLADVLGWLVSLDVNASTLVLADTSPANGAPEGNGLHENNGTGTGTSNGTSNGTSTGTSNGTATGANPEEFDPHWNDPHWHDPNRRDPNSIDPNLLDSNLPDPNQQDPNLHDPNTHNPDESDQPLRLDLISNGAVWLRTACLTAVEMVAKGRTVPLLQRIRTPRNRSKPDTGTFAVDWVPAVPASRVFNQLVESVPGTVKAIKYKTEPKALVEEVWSTTVNALMRNVTARIDVPQAPHEPRTRAELIEAYLASMNGEPFTASASVGSELLRRLEQWARPVLTPARYWLIVKLEEPDESGAWHMSVLSPGPNNSLDPVEVALVAGTNAHRSEVKTQLARLESLLPVLMRPGGKRRGEVILSQEEAWDLMAVTGPALQAAGFEVRVPPLSRKKPQAGLRLTAENSDESLVGAQQLTAVSWTAMFGDIELTAAEIHDLASQARPLVQNHGTWVALDHADLAEAASALAERADVTQLTGAQMLRQALGLEGTTLAGGVSISDGTWAADLLKAAAAVPESPSFKPAGFNGELRHYQAEALAWLDFLDEAGLGGCLALDMGLGKTPTVLARIAQAQQMQSQNGQAQSGQPQQDQPTLVIAPPAVVGNWASEAARFTPMLAVEIHHGANRSSGDALEAKVALADLVITTYGTAVRDIEALSQMQWGRVIVDEAQVIKNHNSETARQLRKLNARTRIALTGTPIENGLADLWSIMDFCSPGLVGERAEFISHLSQSDVKANGKSNGKTSKANGKSSSSDAATETALHALNGVLVFRRTKNEPAIAAELPDRIDDLDHCTLTPEQIGLYQAVLDQLIADTAESEQNLTARKGAVLAAITALKQICNHPLNYQPDGANQEIEGRSGKLARLNEILEVVFAAQERVLIFTHFATWGDRLAKYLADYWDLPIDCYHGGLSRGARDDIVQRFQNGTGPGAMVLSLKAGGTGLNLAAASHVVLYDRWWNPAVEDQARDRAWRIGQTKTVICHRLVCPGTVDERVEEVVAGKRRIADMVLPKSSSLGDLNAEQLRTALGINENLLTDIDTGHAVNGASK